jgi:hypothetical protein
LIGGDLHRLVSAEIKDICRLIDVVNVKGSVKPLSLYTVDVNLNLQPSKKKYIEYNLKEKRNLCQLKRDKVISGIKSAGSIGIYTLHKNSFKELLNTRRSTYFYGPFKEGVNFYLKGKWDLARDKFINECLFLDQYDGPTNTLVRYMQSYNFKKFEGWVGVRPLDKK